MKYYEVEFSLTPCSQDACDVLSALCAEAGFETFEEKEGGLLGYVQQQFFDQSVLDAVLEEFPFADTHIIYKVREAEDKDWNEQWEQEGFEPIVVRGRQQAELVIHDGRHLPDTVQRSRTEPSVALQSPFTVQRSPFTVEIDARLAFGTGTHETTRMMCATLLDLFSEATDSYRTANVLDCGCGTGILGICALKLGAAQCTAYDIDEWSVDNTRHNAVINQVDERMTILHGDATLLDSMTEKFDIVMANINRNILLQDMERFVSVMAPKAILILSGFYQDDCTLLVDKAQSLGLTLQQTRHDGEWACITVKMLNA